ncbi:MAG: hypothetical protein RLZ98_1802 [Pseudomonadota bacterium]|jgi:hypothetical protein
MHENPKVLRRAEVVGVAGPAMSTGPHLSYSKARFETMES